MHNFHKFFDSYSKSMQNAYDIPSFRYLKRCLISPHRHSFGEPKRCHLSKYISLTYLIRYARCQRRMKRSLSDRDRPSITHVNIIEKLSVPIKNRCNIHKEHTWRSDSLGFREGRYSQRLDKPLSMLSYYPN